MKVDVVRLREIANGSKAGSAIFKAFLNRERDRRTTDLRQFHARLEDRISMDELLLVFKHLEDARVGSLILGRRGIPPKFKWEYSLRSIGEAVTSPKEATILSLKDKRKPEKNIPIVKNDKPFVAVYHLRENFKLKLALPPDFNKKDAMNLSSFFYELSLEV